MTVRLYDRQFNLVGEGQLDPLAAGSHLALYAHQLFEDGDVQAITKEMEGLLTVATDQPLAAVTLRQNDAPNREFR